MSISNSLNSNTVVTSDLQSSTGTFSGELTAKGSRFTLTGLGFFRGKQMVGNFTHSGSTSTSIADIHNNDALWTYDAAQFSNLDAQDQYGDVNPGSGQSWYWNSYIGVKFDYGIYVGDGLILVASDRRNKHRIEEINDSKALDIIRKINVYTFYFKDKFAKPTQLQFDVMAQDVLEHFPNAVSVQKIIYLILFKKWK